MRALPNETGTFFGKTMKKVTAGSVAEVLLQRNNCV